MRGAIVVIGVVLGSCGAQPSSSTLPPRHRGVADNLAESRRHEREAARHDALVRGEPTQSHQPGLECTDDPVEGVSYSGTEPYKLLRPCWTGVLSPTQQHREEAQRHRDAAAAYRARAEALVAAEGRSCAGLGQEEISRSPLTRTDDILRVAPLFDGGEIVGARVVLRPVPGLTAMWLQRSLACHQARAAALGYPADFMVDCPLTLPNVSVEVETVADGIEVRIRSDRDDVAAAVVGRAQALVEPAP